MSTGWEDINQMIIHRQEKWEDDPYIFNDPYVIDYDALEELKNHMAAAQAAAQAANKTAKQQTKQLQQQLQQAAKQEEVEDEVQTYIPVDVFKPFLKKILNKMSEDDCRAFLQAVFDNISKDDTKVKISPSVETAIIAIMVDKAS